MGLVYMITSSTSGKNYIGFTTKTFFHRFRTHYTNALAGILDTHFYRAIRKYGIEDFTHQILWEGNDNECGEMEKHYIKLYNTYKNGYNMTEGGDGGITTNKRTPEEQEAYILFRINESTRENNGRWSGWTDDDIVDMAVQHYIDNGNNWLHTDWLKLCKNNNIPQNFSKNRFGGSINGLKQLMIPKLLNLGIIVDEIKYKRTKQHGTKLSTTNSSQKRHWYTNILTKERKQTSEDLTQLPNWIKGRKK